MKRQTDPNGSEHPDLRHARACVHFAVVTSQPIAAELIDKAVALRRAVPSGR